MLTCLLEDQFTQHARVIFANSFVHYFGDLGAKRDRREGFSFWITDKLFFQIACYFMLIWDFLVRCPGFCLGMVLPGPSSGIGRFKSFQAYGRIKQLQIAMVTLLCDRWNDSYFNDLFDPESARPLFKPPHKQAPLSIRDKRIIVHAYNTGLPKTWLDGPQPRPIRIFHRPA